MQDGGGAGDSRQVVAYLVAPEADEYVAVMGVLESSVSDLTPREVARGLVATRRIVVGIPCCPPAT